MGTSAWAALVFLPFVLPIALWVAYSDLSQMRIPNLAVLALVAVYVIVGPFVLPFTEFAARLLHLIIVLIVGFLLTLTGLVGAGDAKFASAMAPFIAAQDLTIAALLLATTAIIGFVTHRLAKISTLRKITPDWESWVRVRDFPMGYPLAGMLVIYLGFAALN